MEHPQALAAAGQGGAGAALRAQSPVRAGARRDSRDAETLVDGCSTRRCAWAPPRPRPTRRATTPGRCSSASRSSGRAGAFKTARARRPCSSPAGRTRRRRRPTATSTARCRDGPGRRVHHLLHQRGHRGARGAVLRTSHVPAEVNVSASYGVATLQGRGRGGEVHGVPARAGRAGDPGPPGLPSGLSAVRDDERLGGWLAPCVKASS